LLEVIIILCLAGTLFLLLKHYPDAKTLKFPISKESLSQFIGKFKFKGKNISREIAEEIARDQDGVISPRDLEDAAINFDEDPELARILVQADRLHSEGDLRGAEDKAVEAISKNKKCAKAYALIGNIASSRGQFSEAKEAYRAALKCNPDFAEAYFGLGTIELREENHTEATELLAKSVALDKNHPDWYAELGKSYIELRQYAKAAKAFKRATSLDMNNKEYRDLASEAEEKQKSHAIYTRSKPN